jgi:hypothetical protein
VEKIAAVKKFMIKAPGLALKYFSRVIETESNKHTSLLQFRINSFHKKFYGRGPWTCPKIFECCESY